MKTIGSSHPLITSSMALWTFCKGVLRRFFGLLASLTASKNVYNLVALSRQEIHHDWSVLCRHVRELFIPDQDVALFLQATKIRTGLHASLPVVGQVRPHYFCEFLWDDSRVVEQDRQRADNPVVSGKVARAEQKHLEPHVY
jgi:hypothetical protein